MMTLERIVKNDSKKRYTLASEVDQPELGFWWMRANQGHSMDVRILLSVPS
jgi:RNA:NAD 2'-phosphotransferase (TPT1/KptA family)